MKPLLRFKTKNELKKTDYKRLAEFLKENPRVSIELSMGVDLEFASVSPIVVEAKGYGYRIRTEILFERPIGFEVYDDLKLDGEMRSCLAVNRRNLELSKVVVEPVDFEKDLNLVLSVMERTVNQICNKFGRLVELTLTIGSNLLDKRLDMVLRKEELEKRGETARPFGTIHAKSSKDAKERVAHLVPIYMERDKSYLYEDKKVFMLLPRSFVMKLLKLEGPAMMPVDQFTDEEIEVLKRFSMRHYVKTREVGGKIYYSELDETTRKLLLKGLKKG